MAWVPMRQAALVCIKVPVTSYKPSDNKRWPLWLIACMFLRVLPTLVSIYWPSAFPDVNKDWTHGAVHSHTVTLQSSSCLTSSLSKLSQLFFFFFFERSNFSLRPPPTSIFDFHPAICTTTTTCSTAWCSNHTHTLYGFVLQICLPCWSSGCPCLSFLWTGQTSRETLKCVRVERALQRICPLLCDEWGELSIACHSSCLQLSVQVCLSRTEALELRNKGTAVHRQRRCSRPVVGNLQDVW